MARIVYDPTADRKQKNVKVFSASPKQREQPKTVVFDSKVPPKGKATVKKETIPATEKLKKPMFTDEEFLEALKAVGHPASSREIVDKLGIGR
jgi:dephospho-CoA kinase